MRLPFPKRLALALRCLSSIGMLFAGLPASTNFKMNDYSFGSGGSANSSSANYSADSQVGELSGGSQSSTLYKFLPGLFQTQQAAVPAAPSLTNPGSYYNKLLVTLAASSNPSDTRYAIAVSSDSFATASYLNSDGTLSPTLSIANFKTYAQWGSGSGTYVVGLQPATTYQVKARSYRGKYTDSPFGPLATASTSSATLSFSIATDTQSSPPFSLSFGSLPPGIVTLSPQKILVSLTTNGTAGGSVYVASLNASLKSVRASYSIASATANLAVASEGYGAQYVSASQASGATFAALSPFNGSGSAVGALTASQQAIFSSPGAVTGGQGSFYLKAKAAAGDPAATDYSDTLLLTASAGF